MDRRDFIKTTAAAAAFAAVPSELRAAASNSVAPGSAPDGQDAPGSLIVSAPMLQNYAATSMGVAFAVSANANGFVRYSTSADMANAKTVKCGGFRVTDMNSDVMLVRLTGLKPATRYYYTIGADRISYEGGYKMKILGTEEDPRVYSFTTAGKGAEGHFCVINDTHAVWSAFGAAVEKIAALQPSCVVWNGDASNCEESIESQKRIFLAPKIDRKDYAACLPYMFSPGNHDSRGLANRHLERVWMMRQNEERPSRDWDLGRNFAVRVGDIALIGLDTAEDKLDSNPLFAGLFNSTEYREAQAVWLRDALKRKEIASAPFLVAVCHIPLFDSRENENPGDVFPDDKDPRYSTGYARWQRTCNKLWGPLLNKAGCQLVISGHQHAFRYEAPAGDRRWAQLVGGGRNLESETGYPTVIEVLTDSGKLLVRVHNLRTGAVQQEFSFKRR